MTTEEIGRGSCGVEAKCLQQVTISQYILCQLNREISIATELATKLHHPSLLLFICAIRGKELVILTELMPTNLHKELEKNRELSIEQVISIGPHMSFGLTYMHQLRPHPIIHHEISSGNILLEPLSNGLMAKIPDYSSDTHHSPVVLWPKQPCNPNSLKNVHTCGTVCVSASCTQCTAQPVFHWNKSNFRVQNLPTKIKLVKNSTSTVSIFVDIHVYNRESSECIELSIILYATAHRNLGLVSLSLHRTYHGVSNPLSMLLLVTL